MANALEAYPDLVLCRDAYDAAEGADALLIATDWREFGALDWQRVRNSMLRPLLIDGRNLLSPSRMMSLGFEYVSVGRPI
jgi:UDPglucose 6-dehydrogenase